MYVMGYSPAILLISSSFRDVFVKFITHHTLASNADVFLQNIATLKHPEVPFLRTQGDINYNSTAVSVYLLPLLFIIAKRDDLTTPRTASSSLRVKFVIL